MKRKYTISINHNEYMQGLFDTEKEAWMAIATLIVKDDPTIEIEESIDGDDFSEIADSYGYYVQDIYLK